MQNGHPGYGVQGVVWPSGLPMTGGTGASPANIQSRFLGEVESSLDQAVKDLHECIATVREFADATIGAEPVGPPTNGIAGEESHVRLDRIRARFRWLGDSLITLRGQVNRLNAL